MNLTIIGCGYVGTAVARFLKVQSHVLTVTTTTPDRVEQLSQIASRVVVMKGGDREQMLGVVKNADVVLLSVGARTRNFDIYRETYLGTAQNLVAALQETGRVRQLIYTSSHGVLGDKQGAWVDETTPVAPINENGRVLVEMEEVLLGAATDKLKVCVLRLAGIYGPGRELINIFRSWSGTTRPGTGENYTNWVHLDDIVAGIELVRKQELEGIYHLSCDVPMVRREFFDCLFQVHGLTPLFWDGLNGTVPSYNVRLSNTRIKKMGLKLIWDKIKF